MRACACVCSLSLPQQQQLMMMMNKRTHTSSSADVQPTCGGGVHICIWGCTTHRATTPDPPTPSWGDTGTSRCAQIHIFNCVGNFPDNGALSGRCHSDNSGLFMC